MKYLFLLLTLTLGVVLVEGQSITGTWVVQDTSDLDFDNESYARYLRDTIFIREDNSFMVSGKDKICCMQWEFDSTEKLFLILDMDKADGREYTVEIKEGRELIFTGIPNARKKIAYRRLIP